MHNKRPTHQQTRSNLPGARPAERDPRAELLRMSRREREAHAARQRAEEERLVRLGGTRKR